MSGHTGKKQPRAGRSSSVTTEAKEGKKKRGKKTKKKKERKTGRMTEGGYFEKKKNAQVTHKKKVPSHSPPTSLEPHLDRKKFNRFSDRKKKKN